MNATITPETITPATVIVGRPEPLVINPAADERPALSPDDARQLTIEIQRTSVRLWLLVTEAHDRQAHTALGYSTWDEYARKELKMSPSRSYQLLDTGHVMRELAAGGADLDRIAVPPTRVVQRVKDRLDEVREVARTSVIAGKTPEKALRMLARSAPADGTPGEKQLPDEGEAEERSSPDQRGRTAVKCPACAGSGKVARPLANKLRAFVRNQ